MILVITRLMSSECRSVKCLYTFCEYLDLNFLILGVPITGQEGPEGE